MINKFSPWRSRTRTMRLSKSGNVPQTNSYFFSIIISWAAYFIDSLPYYFLAQNNSIRGILCREGIATILHAEHEEWLLAIVAN